MCLEVLESAADQAAQKGMPREKLQQQRGLVLGEIAGVRRCLMGDPPTKDFRQDPACRELDAGISVHAGIDW